MKSLIIASFLISTNVFGWGSTGHRVVGEIAADFLTVPNASKVHKILKGESLARVSTWPDEIKSEPDTYRYTFNWHYTDWPEDMDEHDEHESSGVLLGSITDQLKVLKNPRSSEDKKAFALKFLVHLIGDLHMPLHVGNGLDMGGNNCKVLFHKKPMNLHSLWDSAMIEFTKLSFTELAKFARQGVKAEEIQAWKKGGPVDWAQESKNIRSTLYPENVATNIYCRNDIRVLESDMPQLGYEYSYQFMPIIEKRLFQAGVRLAMLLNQIL